MPKYLVMLRCSRARSNANQTVPKDDFKAIREAAVNLDVEAIQVAAMAKKFEHGQRHNWPGGKVPDYGTEPAPLEKKGGKTA